MPASNVDNKCYDPGPNFSFHTPTNYIPPAPAPAAPILPPIHHAAPPIHHVSVTTQPPVQLPSVYPLEPFSDNANNLYTSENPKDIDMGDSMEDS
jgi:hypothetical protein